MKILAIPRNNDKKYSFELFELLRHYQNEVINFLGGSKIPEIRFFSILNKIKDPFILENELINKKLDKILNCSQFNFLWNLGLNREYLPYITQKSRQNKIRLVQTISDDAVLYNQRNIVSQAIFPEIPSASINKIINFYASDIDLFISHSQFLKGLLIQSGISEEKIIHIPMFVDAQKYSPYYKSEEYFTYQYTSKDDESLKFLLKIMEEIPQHKLMIISDGKPNPEIKALIEKYTLYNVLWVENLNSSQKQNIIKLSRFSIILSGIKHKKILESYAQGKPVLAIDSGANSEYIVDTYSGLLFKNNKEDIINKIDYLMTNQTFCQDSGAFARNLAENCFDKQNHYRQIFNAFNAIERKMPLQQKKTELLNIS